jgi:hypothetical protein
MAGPPPVVRSPVMIPLALALLGAVIGYFYAGALVAAIGVKAVGALAGFGAGSVIALILSILSGEA